MFGAYYRLTKPGIIYGNIFTVIAGFLFASQLHVALVSLGAVVLGMTFVIASACVFNNVTDRRIDAKMVRTKERALVTGVISVRSAVIFAIVLGMLGSILLFFHTNPLTACIALVGFVFYVGFYGYAKRVTRAHTLVGSISGAVPILAGYTASTNQIDSAGIILFLILVLWQMPHFYAIALYRLEEYTAAGIPLLPSVKGVFKTKVVIVAYIAAFIGAESTLTMLGYTGYLYLTIVFIVGGMWLLRGLSGFKRTDDAIWARELFLFSLKVLVAFSVAVSFGALLP